MQLRVRCEWIASISMTSRRSTAFEVPKQPLVVEMALPSITAAVVEEIYQPSYFCILPT